MAAKTCPFSWIVSICRIPLKHKLVASFGPCTTLTCAAAEIVIFFRKCWAQVFGLEGGFPHNLVDVL